MKKLKYVFIVLFVLALGGAVYLLLSATKPEPTAEGHYTYSIADGAATITACDTSLSGSVTVPSHLGGFPVTVIASHAFKNCRNISTLSIPDSVREIQMYAFENCSDLISVNIPASVTNIDGEAFSNCTKLSGIWVDKKNTAYSSDSYGVLYDKELSKLIRAPMNLTDAYSIPDSVQAIGDRAFFGCTNLTKVVIPDGVTGVDWYAFSNCKNLASIVLPDSIESIGSEVFRGCNKLSNVYYKGSEDAWKNVIIKSGNNRLTDATIQYDYCDHIWDDGIITKVATCKESGIRTYTCTLCNRNEMRAIPKLTTHQWNSGNTTKAPTCKDAGVKTYTCSVCEATRTESIAKLTTHTWNSGVATKEPSCKELGILTHTCNICGATKTTDIPKLLTHNYNTGETTKEPTCKEKGVITFTCTICGDYYTEDIPMLTEHIPGDPATETTDQVCTSCGEVLAPATGMPEEKDEENTRTGGFFGPIIDFFNAIAELFENLFAPIMKLFGL